MIVTDLTMLNNHVIQFLFSIDDFDKSNVKTEIANFWSKTLKTSSI